MSESAVIDQLWKFISVVELVVVVLVLFILFFGVARRGGAATALGVVGVLLMVPAAAYSVAVNFSWIEYSAWPSVSLWSVHLVGFVLALLGLLIAKSPAPRAPHPAWQPPAHQHPYGAPPPPYGQVR